MARRWWVARELSTLCELLDGALSGCGALALLAGEPGIGKTRLAEELAAIARQRAAVVLWGRCWEAEGAPAFRPWVEALRPLIRDEAAADLITRLGPGAVDLAQLLPEVRELAPTPPPLPAAALVDADNARFRLFDAVAGLLRAAAARAPLLLVLEDVHWADKPSVLLLQFLARELTTMPVMLLGSYRDSDLDRLHPLALALPALRREHASERLVLRGLNDSGVRALVEALLVHRDNRFHSGLCVRALNRAEASTAERPQAPSPVFCGRFIRPRGVQLATSSLLRTLPPPGYADGDEHTVCFAAAQWDDHLPLHRRRRQHPPVGRAPRGNAQCNGPP